MVSLLPDRQNTNQNLNNTKRWPTMYGEANWRKLKDICHVELEDSAVFKSEVHWYEGHGIGKKEMKIKRFMRS